MPFYEYKAKDQTKSCPTCVERFEIQQSIKDAYLTFCPDCGSEIIKLVSQPSGFVFGYRQMSQYNDVTISKTWRDKNGTLHKVNPGDGHLKSPAPSKKITRTPEQIAAIKKRDEKIRQKDRLTRGSGRKRIDT